MFFRSIAVCFAITLLSQTIERFTSTERAALFDAKVHATHSAAILLLLLPWRLSGRINLKTTLMCVFADGLLKFFRTALSYFDGVEKGPNTAVAYEICSAAFLISHGLYSHILDNDEILEQLDGTAQSSRDQVPELVKFNRALVLSSVTLGAALWLNRVIPSRGRRPFPLPSGRIASAGKLAIDLVYTVWGLQN